MSDYSRDEFIERFGTEEQKKELKGRQDWSENKLFYENGLEHLEELPQKEKHR